MRRMRRGIGIAALACGIVGGAFCIASLCLGFGKKDLRQIADYGKAYIRETDLDNGWTESEREYGCGVEK